MFWLCEQNLNKQNIPFYHLALSVCDLLSHYVLDTCLCCWSQSSISPYPYPFSHRTSLSIGEAPRQVLSSSRCLFRTALLYCIERTLILQVGRWHVVIVLPHGLQVLCILLFVTLILLPPPDQPTCLSPPPGLSCLLGCMLWSRDCHFA